MKIGKIPVPLIVPNPDDPRLTERVIGVDQTGIKTEIRVPVERPLTLYLNAQEIVTMMTINDYPEYLALGYLLNQNMLKYDDVVTEVEYDDDLQVVVIFDLGDDVVIFEHVLVEQVAEGEIFRIVPDRHHGDDLLRVQIQRQRPLDRHLGFDPGAGLVYADDALGQARVVRIGDDQGHRGFLDLHHGRDVSMTFGSSRYKHGGEW